MVALKHMEDMVLQIIGSKYIIHIKTWQAKKNSILLICSVCS